MFHLALQHLLREGVHRAKVRYRGGLFVLLLIPLQRNCLGDVKDADPPEGPLFLPLLPLIGRKKVLLVIPLEIGVDADAPLTLPDTAALLQPALKALRAGGLRHLL